jgi:hypothetical protein
VQTAGYTLLESAGRFSPIVATTLSEGPPRGWCTTQIGTDSSMRSLERGHSDRLFELSRNIEM